MPIRDGEEGLEGFAAAFDSEAAPSYPRLGARFIESDGLAVTEVIAGGPASAAGLAPGDRVVAVAGQPVSTLRGLHDRIRPLAGREAVLRLAGQPDPREIRLPIEAEPGAWTLADTTMVDQVVTARLGLALLRSDGAVPRWLLELNQAAIFLRAGAYEAAVPLLRTIQAPAGAGLSRAMIDYWLATTLLSLDPRTYGDAARNALERALEQEGARLYHDDGPLLAPRARARLAELDRALAD